MKQQGKPFEVIFLSCDQDEASAQAYFKGMPWLMIPFEEDARERAIAAIKVTGIPRLQVIGTGGQVLHDNAVQVPLSPAIMDAWLAGRPQ